MHMGGGFGELVKIVVEWESVAVLRVGLDVVGAGRSMVKWRGLQAASLAGSPMRLGLGFDQGSGCMHGCLAYRDAQSVQRTGCLPG